MATFSIEELTINSEDPNVVSNWIERLEQMVNIAIFHAASNLPTDETAKAAKIEEVKRSYLLSSLGSTAYKLLKSYCAPDLPTTKTFAQLLAILKAKLAPPPNSVSEQYRFSLVKQEDNETLAVFMGRIREAAVNCGFGNLYSMMVKNRFMGGLRSERIRTALLSDCNPETTMDQVYQKAVLKEQASQSNSAMNPSSSVNAVGRKTFTPNYNRSGGKNHFPPKSNHSPSNNTPKSSVTCDKCTLRGHVAANCFTKCRFCKKQGHIKKQCPKLHKRNAHQVGTNGNGFVDGMGEKSDGDGGIEEDYGYDPAATNYIHRVKITGDSEETGKHDGESCICCSLVNKELNQVNGSNVISSDIIDYSNIICDNDKNVDNNVVVNSVNLNLGKPFLNVKVNGKPLKMELDTGSTLSCISKTDFEKLKLANCKVENCTEQLCVANGQFVNSLCRAIVVVEFKGNRYRLPLCVVDARFPTLLGRDWIRVMMGEDWLTKMVNLTVNQVKSRKEFVESIKHSSVFNPGVGEVKGFEASLDLKPNARPKFCKARPIPFAIKETVGEAIDKLVDSGLWRPISFSEYASPIVPVTKDDGTIRLCGDYKTTVNPNIDTTVYPLPSMEDCLAELVGGELFTKLDIKQAYNNLRLRESDQQLVAVNTHRGLFAPVRLPYGVSSAGAIFQRKIDQVLQGIPGVTCRVDDICITGPNDEVHMKRVGEVVDRLAKAGFRCRLDKCKFMEPSITYLGHEVSRLGVKPLKCKVETILKAKYPENASELVSFLGAAQYYARYIPDMSTVIEPLNKLRSEKNDWKFGVEEKRAFDELKKRLASNRVLTFYNPALPVKLDADASKHGLGAVLSHVYPDRTERPIEFISRTLSKSERNYSQIEKEALSIVWSIKRFHRYLFARKFTLITDHKPLEFIFHPTKGIPEMGVSRIVRWSLFLSSYQYNIKFRPTGKHANADMCSRFPLESQKDEDIDSEEAIAHSVYSVVIDSEALNSIFSVHYLGNDVALLNSVDIARHTRTDPVLSKVLHFVKEGWSESKEESLKQYVLRKTELSEDSGCVLWGSRVVIPETLRGNILELLHSTHMGMVSMKALARSFVWWPGLDASIEHTVRVCSVCQLNQRKPPTSVPHPWVAPKGPWERIHLDFCGPIFGHMWMVVIDAFSKWIEILRMSNTQTPAVIQELRTLFGRFGIPICMVSDNGPQLKSQEMENFTKKNGIKHIFIPSYHPASNGAAEGLVGNFKRGLKKMQMSKPDLMGNLARWLLMYRNTVHPATGKEPAVAMLGRRTRSAFSILHPLNQPKQTAKLLNHEQKVINEERPSRQFNEGESIMYWDTHHRTWYRGVISGLEGSKVFVIDGENGKTRKHLDQVVKNVQPDPSTLPTREQPAAREPTNQTATQHGNLEHDHMAPRSNEPRIDKTVTSLADLPSNSDTQNPPNTDTSRDLPTRVSTRIKQPVDRLEYSKLGG